MGHCQKNLKGREAMRKGGEKRGMLHGRRWDALRKGKLCVASGLGKGKTYYTEEGKEWFSSIQCQG